MPATYYCPMCGAWFEVGAERCGVCSAPLPETAPDLSAMEVAAVQRAQGISLARAAIAQGARLQVASPRLLVVPLLAAIVIASLLQETVFTTGRGVAGPLSGASSGFFMPSGGSSANNSVVSAVYAQVAALMSPVVLVQQGVESFGLFAMPVPLFGEEAAPSVAAAIIGVQALPPRFGVFVPLFQWMFAVAVLVVNLVQWRMVAAAVRGPGVSPLRGADLMRAAIPTAIISLLPVATAKAAVWSPVSPMFMRPIVDGFFCMLLAAWSSAALFGPAVGAETRHLLRRGLFSSEGVSFVLLTVPILFAAQVVLIVWQGVGSTVFAETGDWIGRLVGILTCMAAFTLTSLVTCAWFCLMNALAGRPDISTMLDRAGMSDAAATGREVAK